MFSSTLLRSRRQGAHELADDAEHDLVGAPADGPQPQVPFGILSHINHMECIQFSMQASSPVQPRDVVLAREPHAAPELQARVGDFSEVTRQISRSS